MKKAVSIILFIAITATVIVAAIQAGRYHKDGCEACMVNLRR